MVDWPIIQAIANLPYQGAEVLAALVAGAAKIEMISLVRDNLIYDNIKGAVKALSGRAGSGVAIEELASQIEQLAGEEAALHDREFKAAALEATRSELENLPEALSARLLASLDPHLEVIRKDCDIIRHVRPLRKADAGGGSQFSP